MAETATLTALGYVDRDARTVRSDSAGHLPAPRATGGSGRRVGTAAEPAPGLGRAPARCQWCGREIGTGNGGVGRPRLYCAQSCRQRAYEHRSALQRGGLPADAVVLSAAERDDLADRLFQVRCAAEDVATALAEAASPGELQLLVAELIATARSAERIRRG